MLWVLVVCVVATPDKWVLLSIDSSGDNITVDQWWYTKHQHSVTRRGKVGPLLAIDARGSAATIEWRGQAGPRTADWWDGDNNDWGGTTVHSHPTVVPVVVPGWTTSLGVPGTTITHVALLGSTSKYSVQGTSTPEVIPQQVIGNPSKHKNLVFLATGYTQGERGVFLDDVKYITSFLLQATEVDVNKWKKVEITANPYPRYHSLMNIWAVFAADPASGLATEGNPKPTVLDCRYGTGDPRAQRTLLCDDAKVFAAASHCAADPQSSVYVVLANDLRYGGSGGGKVAVISSRSANVLKLVIHELGHADGWLMDEYTYGYTTERHIEAANCHWDATTWPWRNWTALGTPTTKCTYDNYYRPTDASCLLKTIHSAEFCPVCREALILDFYNDMRDLASPRCPREDQWLITALTDTVVLHVNHRILLQEHITGELVWPNGTRQRPVLSRVGPLDKAVLEFPASALGLGNHSLVYTTTDDTPWVLAEHRPLRTSSVFLVMVVPDAAAVQAVPGSASARCSVFEDFFPQFRGVCEKPNCEDYEHIAYPFEAEDFPVEKYQHIALILGITTGASVLLVAILAVAYHTALAHTRTEIHDQCQMLRVVRVIMMSTAAAVLLTSVGCVATCVYFLQVLQNLQASVLYGLTGACGVLFFLGFLGFVATYYGQKGFLIGNGVCLLLLCGALAFFTYEVYHYTSGIADSDADTRNEVRLAWLNMVETNAEEACFLQRAFGCSGFLRGCHVAPDEYCPRHCDRANGLAQPCYGKLEEWVRESRVYLQGGSMGLTALTAVAFILNAIYVLRFHHVERRTRGQPALEMDAPMLWDGDTP